MSCNFVERQTILETRETSDIKTFSGVLEDNWNIVMMTVTTRSQITVPQFRRLENDPRPHISRRIHQEDSFSVSNSLEQEHDGRRSWNKNATTARADGFTHTRKRKITKYL